MRGQRTHPRTGCINIARNSFSKRHVCRPAGRTAARARPAISVISGDFVFPASRGVSMVTIYAGGNRKITSRPLGGRLLFAARSERLPPFSWHSGPSVQERPAKAFHRWKNTTCFRSCFRYRLRLSLRQTCFDTPPRTSQVLVLPLSRRKDAGRRGFIGAINVCCLDNSNKIKMNHQPANEHLQP